MLRARPDLQEKLVAGLGEPIDPPDEVAEMLDPFQYVASANYVVPMLLGLAIDRANEVVDAVPRYSSADHGAIWSSLIASISRFDRFMYPYFEDPLAPDPFAEELLRHEHQRLARLHAAASFEQDLWRLVEDDDGLRIRLAPKARRSALHLVANKADFLANGDAARRLLQEEMTLANMEEFALTIGTDELSLLRTSCPDAWARLEAGVPFEIDLVPWFRAFQIRLAQTGPRWLDRDLLWRYWTDFTAEQPVREVDRAEWEAIVDFHSLTPEEASSWGLPGAFIRFEHALAVWPFVFHVLHPDLNFIALLMRRHGDLWSRTLGSDLARVADQMASRFPADGRILARARRKRSGVGEVDLALLDRETGDVLVLELKTVFDRFRTHFQLSSYADQRVDFAKAIAQARTAAEAIRGGAWSPRDLFGAEAPASANSVTPGLLTWWDNYNPTLGSEEPIICCNFAAFEYLSREAASLPELIGALEELPQIYCPGTLHEGFATGGGERFEFRREVQTDILPAIEPSRLGPLTRRVLADIPQLSDIAPDPEKAPPFTY